LTLLFMMRVMVWYFVSDTHKGMSTPIVVILVLVFLQLTEWFPSKLCRRVFSILFLQCLLCNLIDLWFVTAVGVQAQRI
jgi:hypothetical protein